MNLNAFVPRRGWASKEGHGQEGKQVGQGMGKRTGKKSFAIFGLDCMTSGMYLKANSLSDLNELMCLEYCKIHIGGISDRYCV